MALQPTVRLAGSQHIIRFQGNLVQSASPGPQALNAEVPQGAVANTETFVGFALADLTNLADQSKRLPAGVYDDAVPAGSSPHSNTTTSGPSLPILGLPAGKTFGQNIKVRCHEASASTASPRIARVDTLLPRVVLDTTGSPLVLANSGVPIVGVAFYFTADGIAALSGAQPVGVPIVLEIEVPHTSIR